MNERNDKISLVQTTAMFVILMNIIAPGVGTIISAFLGSECQNATVYVGIGQALTTPLLGLGLIWGIVWSIKLYKSAGTTSEDAENPLLSTEE